MKPEQSKPAFDLPQFEGRKRDHIEQSLKLGNQAQGLSGLDRVALLHEALPELDLEEVSLSEDCFSRSLATPFFVPGMTMGHSGALELNHRLAQACEARGWVMGVGSQRRELESLEASRDASNEGRNLRRAAPRAVLLANLGISQLIRARSEQVGRLIESIEAQALVVHLNSLQEAIQPEGTPQFKGGLAAIERVVREISVPVVVKETGCGFSCSTLERLISTGVAAVDVSGLGGTHWGRVEGARSKPGSLSAQLAATFANWGNSTVDSVRAAAKALSSSKGSSYFIWASGGVRNGLDAAKLIALGAHRVGFAQPALQAALEGEAALVRWMEQMEQELRVALFCVGASKPSQLRGRGVHEQQT